MRREHVDAILGRFAHMPGAGIILLKRMRTLLRYAREMGWRERSDNRCASLQV
jgi:hypothetical protein